MTPPASTEPVFGILLSELYEWERENLCWSEVQDLQRRIRARGPVQRAPSLDEKDRIFVLLSDPETRREIVDRLSQPWSIEILQEIERIRKEHDAALIAQEREKWERERLSCVEDITPEGAAIVQAVKTQAREDVLDDLAQMYANVPEQFLEGTYRLHSEWKEKIESLRHGQKQERDPE